MSLSVERLESASGRSRNETRPDTEGTPRIQPRFFVGEGRAAPRRPPQRGGRMTSLSKQGSAMLSNFFTLVATGEENLGDSEFAATWEIRDTTGDPFVITLFGSGTAEGNRAEEGLSGMWTVEGPEDRPTAVISWESGWTTKITRTGTGYVKTAYDATAATPANTSEAVKIQ
jgi:hypothetical protein